MDKNTHSNEKIEGWCSQCQKPMVCTYLVEKYRINEVKCSDGSHGSHGSHGEILTLICEDCNIRNAVLNFSDNDKNNFKR